MPRLIDDIRAAKALQMPWFVVKEREWAAHTQRVLDILKDRQLPVLLIDNVADYYFKSTDQEFWTLDRDFPNGAPPFPSFWCEHRLPKLIHSREHGDTHTGTEGGRIGVFCAAVDPALSKYEGQAPEGVKWILWSEIFVDYGRWRSSGLIDGPVGSIFMCVDAEGRFLGLPWMQSYAASDEYSLEVMRSMMTWLHPMLLAVSFLHCKNVALEDHKVDAPLAKKYRARHGVDPTPYKTLVIEPLKAILRKEGGHGSGNGLAKALHICRGHFRDYREGRGLFGKYHGQFWIPATVRGTKGKSAPAREIEVRV
jgi:hypothetical protein